MLKSLARSREYIEVLLDEDDWRKAPYARLLCFGLFLCFLLLVCNFVLLVMELGCCCCFHSFGLLGPFVAKLLLLNQQLFLGVRWKVSVVDGELVQLVIRLHGHRVLDRTSAAEGRRGGLQPHLLVE